MQGQVQEDGTIKWENAPTVQWIVKRARIRELQERAKQIQ